MATWEYRVVEAHLVMQTSTGPDTAEKTQQSVNELGRQGWELVTVHPFYAYWCLKRQKS